MKVLIAYFSASGTTETMAQYIAEGVRFSGNEVIVLKIEEIKNLSDIRGYDGYIFGSPTYSLDLPEPVKGFLLMTAKANLKDKLGGAFGGYTHDVSYQHDTHAPGIIFSKLQNDFKMKPFELGPFFLNEKDIETRDGLKTCQDYGRVFGETLNKQAATVK